MLLPTVLGALTLLLSGLVAVLGMAGFFFPLHMLSAVAWETMTGRSVEQSTHWYVGVATITTLCVSLGLTTWGAARVWDDGQKVAWFVGTGVAVHLAAALVWVLRGGVGGGAV